MWTKSIRPDGLIVAQMFRMRHCVFSLPAADLCF